jgi:acetylornithine deacetylase/succinyl-diaminopimelate desuccinylase-like protein
MHGGYKNNVVPGRAEASFDARLLPDTDPDEVLRRLRRVGARHGVDIEELGRTGGPTSGHTPLFELLAEVSAELGEGPLPTASLTPGVTDLRFFRSCGATAYGWVPLVLAPELLATFHGTDERIPVEGFLAACDAMRTVVLRAAT